MCESQTRVSACSCPNPQESSPKNICSTYICRDFLRVSFLVLVLNTTFLLEELDVDSTAAVNPIINPPARRPLRPLITQQKTFSQDLFYLPFGVLSRMVRGAYTLSLRILRALFGGCWLVFMIVNVFCGSDLYILLVYILHIFCSLS